MKDHGDQSRVDFASHAIYRDYFHNKVPEKKTEEVKMRKLRMQRQAQEHDRY